MKKNLGNIDRLIRVLLAAVFAIFYFNNIIPGIPGVIFLALAVAFALTAFIGHCTIYRLLGINSLPKKKVV